MRGLFVFDIIAMFTLGSVFKREKPYVPSVKNKSDVDLTNWKYAKETSTLLVLGLCYLYCVLSPIGLAGGNSLTKITMVFAVIALVLMGALNIKKKKVTKSLCEEY